MSHRKGLAHANQADRALANGFIATIADVPAVGQLGVGVLILEGKEQTPSSPDDLSQGCFAVREASMEALELQLEAVEAQIRDLKMKRAQLREQRALLDVSRAVACSSEMTIEALLLIVAALQDHTAAAVEYPLDMALNSVDDQYDGCTDNMTALVKTKYLPKELSSSEFNFKDAWREAENHSKMPENNLTIDHSFAIYMYTGDKVFRDFNNATRSGRENYTIGKYGWYSLHFLLTEALQILKTTQNRCFDTFRSTKSKFELLNNTVRFGSFASSSYNRRKATFFGNKSCFEIHTCEGAEITNHSKLNHEKEVLIPPYEMFRVTETKTIDKQNDLWCETVYVLNSTGIRSDLNCALTKHS
ncbi:T-cell ecto-ADP-ribosyltransferase 1-like [Danio aesculapii]|uniref:T-cell ecto-ADP-ribosyltransferase 1-like n=1 Tax=Danio aesculapii TaxID=1142201 RepID=UPI0024BF1BDF|nr:T-cell ecto-ADP-ribosyltransferase 1-like [Danio aesculapii]